MERRSGCKYCQDKSCAVTTLQDEELNLLSDNIVECKYVKGEMLFKQGTFNAHVIYLRRGLVKLHMSITPKRDYILKIAKSPSFIGLPTIFGDRRNHFSATAMDEVSACQIDIDIFKRLIFKNGRFAFEIIQDISREEINCFKRYAHQSHQQIPGKLAGALIYLSEVIYEDSKFEISLNRNEFSELISISRESVTRFLSKFKKDGLIDLDKNKIHIKKPKLLRKIYEAG
jgi:CRP/FNR family transcriptional regulator